jgi:hypothetical protein
VNAVGELDVEKGMAGFGKNHFLWWMKAMLNAPKVNSLINILAISKSNMLADVCPASLMPAESSTEWYSCGHAMQIHWRCTQCTPHFCSNGAMACRHVIVDAQIMSGMLNNANTSRHFAKDRSYQIMIHSKVATHSEMMWHVPGG